MSKAKKKKTGDAILVAVIVIALGVFLYAGYNLWGILSEYRGGETEYKELQQYVQPTKQPTSDPDTTAPAADATAENPAMTAPVTVDFDHLKQVNPDIVAWLYCEAIPEISYPVVQGEDNEYYLHHTVEKKKNSSASIFLDYRNSAVFTDPLTIVYGHNMKNRSMFGRLKTYRKEEVYKESPYIWLITPEKILKYEIISVRTVKEKDTLYALTIPENEGKKEYMEQIQKKSAVQTTAEYSGEEPILTLSTCTSKHTDRCVVQAILKEENGW